MLSTRTQMNVHSGLTSRYLLSTGPNIHVHVYAQPNWQHGVLVRIYIYTRLLGCAESTDLLIRMLELACHMPLVNQMI